MPPLINAFNKMWFPTQAEYALAEILRLGVTGIVTVAVDATEHPRAEVPLTVYILVDTGFTRRVLPVMPEGAHVKEEAPETLRVAVFPAQVVTLVTAKVGRGLTVILVVNDEILVQPLLNENATV